MHRLTVVCHQLTRRRVSLAILSVGLFAMILMDLDRLIETAQTASPTSTESPEKTERLMTDTLTVTATKTQLERITNGRRQCH